MLERAEYIDLVADCLEHLDPSIVIRVTGDGPGQGSADRLYGWLPENGKYCILFPPPFEERQLFQGKALESV